MDAHKQTLDEYSGNLIRLTDNGAKDDDFVTPQDPEILELDPETKLPMWWNKIKEKRGDL